jgi:hypothetical protein
LSKNHIMNVILFSPYCWTKLLFLSSIVV